MSTERTVTSAALRADWDGGYEEQKRRK